MSYGKQAYLRLCKKQTRDRDNRQWKKVERVTKLLCSNASNRTK